ncbi:unnamed protein product [Hydatigera taeniaeformis]|uniref:Ubiquitin-like domain-containing protein n=1 Tax=Hydatigena taeniaeformis TaxID=6205 RepID=A0A0R3WI09_HYDTA|nr:unnamed protein product [Hydatigera taeniaeformis]
MQLRIIHRGSEILTLPTNANTPVLQVKTAIARLLGVPPNDQILTSRGVYLEDSRSLHDYEIAESGALELNLPLRYQKIISVRVVISPEEVYSIPTRSNATVAELRAEIAKRARNQNCDISNAFLVCSHWVLNDSRRLDEYEIADNACITIARALEPEKQPSIEPYDYCDDFAEEDSPSRMINVHLLRTDANPFTLRLDPSKPLKSIAKSVETKTGIPEEHQNFILSGRRVDSEKTPDDLLITEGESLYLSDGRIREVYPIFKGRNTNQNDILVHFEVGRDRISMNIPRDWTVKQVQQTLRYKSMMCGGKIDLYFNDVRLESRRTLADYGVSNGSVIHVKTLYL